MNSIRSIFVEKKKQFQGESKELLKDLRENLHLTSLEAVRIINRYDIEGLNDETYQKAKNLILSEVNVDDIYEENIILNEGEVAFAVQYLPGQYDQRADSAIQCIQIIAGYSSFNLTSSKIIILKGNLEKENIEKVKNYYINNVDSREINIEKPKTLELKVEEPEAVEVLEGFNDYSEEALKAFLEERGLAMTIEDLKFCRDYFKNTEKRNPTITEIKVIDTYWSDHCRHTTFSTVIDEVEFEDGPYNEEIKRIYESYKASRDFVYGDKPKAQTLMDLATIGMKELKRTGYLDDLDESEEINACSINITVEIDGKEEPWLLMFKNETHNHPTEIEPFGGAATCIGGAIRDPLSGRSYVYQAMRVSGSGDPRTPIEETIKGKLPQRKITIGAAHGYSSYGNQIGLATGQVTEIYHPGYVAKRMELGAVIAAAPKENVIRETPVSGNKVVLVGGRTGRDGCGGATGSSKEHTEKSIDTCSSEVQKGNALTERKIQRLFRNPEVAKMILRCNDFGAGGVSVAIGEVSEGIKINLDLVPKKYMGLDGTEIAISESQERMAVVIEEKDVPRFLEHCDEENLEATVVAEVTGNRRVEMLYKGDNIVSISRDFLDTNGVTAHIKAKVSKISEEGNFFVTSEAVSESATLEELLVNRVSELNVASQKGLSERFDSTIGAGTVLMPFGGKKQATPTDAMVAKIPVLKGETNTCSIMSFGYNPYLTSWNPFLGGIYSVIEALSKVVVVGGDYRKARLSLQEFFERLGKDEEKWGKPFSALLGAYYAQKSFGTAAIGGKDSMSGTFKDLTVPPTIVTFAVATEKSENIISQEFKSANSKVILLSHSMLENNMPDIDGLKRIWKKVYSLACEGKILSSMAIKFGGVIEAIAKMSFGNAIGIKINENVSLKELAASNYGSIVLELKEEDVKLLEGFDFLELGTTTEEYKITYKCEEISLSNIENKWETVLEGIFPSTKKAEGPVIDKLSAVEKKASPVIKLAKPKVLIPVFPGSNCEYDTSRIFERAGAEAEILVFRNRNNEDINASIDAMVEQIKASQIIMFPGGFSAGDEPDGSGKFITAVLRNPKIKDAIMNHLNNKDGLILGICNGFQALIKVGLVPYGEIRDLDEKDPTLTYNTIGRHISTMVNTKVVSKLSPWLNSVELGDIHSIAVSHGEGRFVGDEALIRKLFENGQIATQYVDMSGNATMESPFNPNGSMFAVEGITSPDGRVFGKMGHSERIGSNIAKNISGNKDQKIFLSGVNYFK
ncbi:phosphoribosylformylglycinamidine synthase [Clostridium cellulovorans]|uniref:Phosphoribosylformylglycinamidine synthase n=1 Tax=Clostridium cellulovorans (strain ATCC 35296 / DSM 3052 / OCM 3 / 743B) TaxID=573061 RepID=D9SWZ6_CLOC7|nr:phosphoribosylformylglycinamidine synthase [Clostridium cellulovorans]ADL51357.1 phosphoribosylformylglycinamidine synthase [Clostridium cellulovorans 743B]